MSIGKAFVGGLLLGALLRRRDERRGRGGHGWLVLLAFVVLFVVPFIVILAGAR